MASFLPLLAYNAAVVITGNNLASLHNYWRSFFCYPTWRYFYPIASFCLAIPTLGLHYYELMHNPQVLVVFPSMGYSCLPDFSHNFRVALFIVFICFGVIPLSHFYISIVSQASGMATCASVNHDIRRSARVAQHGFWNVVSLCMVFHRSGRLGCQIS